jgi:hypothetical protein
MIAIGDDRAGADTIYPEEVLGREAQRAVGNVSGTSPSSH